MVDIILFIIIGVLWKIGGTHKKAWARDIVIPIIMGVYIGFETVWWIGFLSMGSYKIISIGYGISDGDDRGSFLGRTFKKPWLVRGMAGLAYSVVGGCNVFIYSKAFILWGVYCLINFVLNALGEHFKLKDFIVEPLAGLGVASIFFMI